MAARHPGGGLGSAAGSGRGYPDAFTVATTKLSQDWSANRCVSHVNEDWLNTLLDDARFSSIDAMLKVRLLLAGMVALNQQPPASQGSDSLPEREGLQGSLARLQAAAATDADEWVKVTAAAAGQLDGRLDLAAVMQQSAVVHETMTGLRRQMQEPSTQQQLFPPLEDVYVRHNPYVLNPDSGHFRLRPSPRVQPLSTRVSYSSVTPPPPALAQVARQGEHGAAFPRPQAQLPQQRSLPRPGTSAAAGEAGGSLPLSRKGTFAVKHAPKIHLLDEAEQQEMQDVLQKSLKAKGHGVAAHVRHEQVPWQRSRASKPEQQQQQQQRQRQRQQQQQAHRADDEQDEGPGGDADMMEYMEQDISEDFEAAEAAAAAAAAAEVAAAGDDDDAGGISSRAGRRRRQQAAARGEEGADGAVLASMKRAAAAARIEELDALFEDSEDDDGEYAPAPTGVGRSARGLQHHTAESQGAAAAAELEDDLEDLAEVGEEAAAAGMEGVVVEEIRDGDGLFGRHQQLQQLGDGAAAVAAKRRRVIVDDDDDD